MTSTYGPAFFVTGSQGSACTGTSTGPPRPSSPATTARRARRATVGAARGLGVAADPERDPRSRPPLLVDPARHLRPPLPTRSFHVSRRAVRHLLHRDAPRHRAHELAEVAPDALGLVDPGHAVARDGADDRTASAPSPSPCACACGGPRACPRAPVKMHWCAPSLQAVDAELAADAGLRVDLRRRACTTRSRSPHSMYARHGARPRSSLTLFIPCASRYSERPVDHVLDDAVAVVHHRGAHLHARRAERDELGGVAPGRDAADARDGDADVACRARAPRPCAARWASPPGRSSRRWSTRRRRAGSGTMRSRSTPMRLLMVLMSERPSAPPRTRGAAPGSMMSPMLGVSFTSTGVLRELLRPAR